MVQVFCAARVFRAHSSSVLIPRVTRPVRMSLIEKDEKLNITVKISERIFPAVPLSVYLNALRDELFESMSPPVDLSPLL